jgi:NAD(P)-dependent dehydrogenase (short-subunit alcohol dehydrogenase family)
VNSQSDIVPNFSLAGRVALVTGAGRGIGRACALACAAAGANIVLGLRDLAAYADLSTEFQAFGRQVLPVKLDISRREDIDASVSAAIARFGRIDVLINNVGVGPRNIAENVNEKDFDLVLEINLKGTFFMTQAVARTMIERKFGRIINISSQAGTVTLHGESVYCMSKAAINHLTRCLALEWARHGITVNTVAPTFVWTDSTKPSLADPDFHRQTLAHIPLGRIGHTGEVVGAVVFLASPAAALITGTNLLVDGGWSVA